MPNRTGYEQNTEAARGDAPTAAGRSLRILQRSQKQLLRRARMQLLASVIGALSAAAACVALLMLPTNQAVVAAFVLTLGTALITASLMHPRMMVSITTASGAAAMVMIIGQRCTLDPLLQLFGGLLIVGAAVAIRNTRRSTRPALPPTVLAQFAVPAWLACAAALSLPVWTWMATATASVAACLAWRAEFHRTAAAWRASMRSHIRYIAGYPRPRDGAGAAMTAENLAKGAEAEQQTAELLHQLGPRWYVLHSRALHNTAADADHILVGPPGVLLFDSKHRKGRFDCTPWVDGAVTGADWTFNGGELPSDLVSSALFEADRIAWAFRADAAAGQPVRTVLVIHGAEMNVPWGEAKFTVATEVDDETGEPATDEEIVVTMVAADHVVDFLNSLPARQFTSPTRRERRRGHARGLSEDEINLQAQERYVRDLATVAEHLFIPVSG